MCFTFRRSLGLLANEFMWSTFAAGASHTDRHLRGRKEEFQSGDRGGSEREVVRGGVGLELDTKACTDPKLTHTRRQENMLGIVRRCNTRKRCYCIVDRHHAN
ncbi:hypothetical protein CEXT_92161 [Caerostris extrusa]|uniref:Secreted protein n=1 Tax=Caerostris extrusa TaxID=172846 RepID=A0AAV4UH13_CAEEX|nr:hypothetical protein CEXT_92161 [Caerostris extrusa]